MMYILGMPYTYCLIDFDRLGLADDALGDMLSEARARLCRAERHYAPDVKAFQEFAQNKYRESPSSKSWPAGALDKINAL